MTGGEGRRLPCLTRNAGRRLLYLEGTQQYLAIDFSLKLLCYNEKKILIQDWGR